MSHVVQISMRLRDPVAIAAACRRLNLPEPVHGTARLYSAEATGLLVRLLEWEYPIVINTDAGSVVFDNFNEHWGKKAELYGFMQMYAVEVAKLEAHKKGHQVTESQLQDGSIKLQILEGTL
ncbi:hypothetical protein AYO40_02085 [Planctomycetaceae bacterium SCGC AG-212-D15]|nr:hypothetical protein AYO40_02085 [Planctomycetaceae bacterium SCGC AG-212-D15]